MIVHLLVDKMRASKAFNMICSHCGLNVTEKQIELAKALGFRAYLHLVGMYIGVTFLRVTHQYLPVEIVTTLSASKYLFIHST